MKGDVIIKDGKTGIGILITSFQASLMGCICFTSILTMIPGKHRRTRNKKNRRLGELRGTSPRQELVDQSLVSTFLVHLVVMVVLPGQRKF